MAVAFVFACSGVVKLAYANQGAERFVKLGLPAWMAPIVSVVEIGAAIAIAADFRVRLAAIPLAIDMVVAIAVSKAPLLFGPGPEPIGAPPKLGLAAFAYQARLDIAMLLLAIYLVLGGARKKA